MASSHVCDIMLCISKINWHVVMDGTVLTHCISASDMNASALDEHVWASPQPGSGSRMIACTWTLEYAIFRTPNLQNTIAAHGEVDSSTRQW